MPESRDGVGPRSILLVGTGGFAGAGLRYAATTGAPSPVLGTLAVNVVASFALGLVLSEATAVGALSADARLLVATGFLSSLSTYSTFAHQTASLSPTLAVANVAGSYALGFLAVVLAGVLVRRWSS